MTETTEATTAPAAEPEKTPSPTVESTTENGHGDVAEEAKTNGSSTETKEEKKEEVPPPKEMRAIVLTGFGGFKGVKILKKPEPTAQAGEVLIRVRAW